MNDQTQIATRSNNPAVVFQQELSTRADQFRHALPAHITPEKFQRTILTAVTQDPDLLAADRRSLLTACMKAAQDGLLPDKREAALVIFSTSQKDAQGGWQKIKLVQYMPMVYGMRKKILQSGEISTLDTNVVYRREVEEGRFIYEGGTEAMLRHRPMLELTEDECGDDQIVAAYSVAVMKDGTKSFEVMRRGEIDKVRQKSQTGALGQVVKFGNSKGKAIEPKGPWVEWFGEMARKTVMRRHSKTLPMSGDLIDIEAQDDELYARSTRDALASTEPDAPEALPRRTEEPSQIEHQHDDVPRDFERRRVEPEPIRREEEDEETARQLDARQEYGETIDHETGEVLDERGPSHGNAHEHAQATGTGDQMFDDLAAKIVEAASRKDVKTAEDEFMRICVNFSDQQCDELERELKATKKRLDI